MPERKAKKAIALTIAATAFAAAVYPAQAQRVDVRQLSCGQAQGLVQQYGAVLMTFTTHTYDRVVKNRQFCKPGEITKAKYVATRDSGRCNVGNICIQNYIKKNK